VSLVDGLGGEEESLGRHFLLCGDTLPLRTQRGRGKLDSVGHRERIRRRIARSELFSVIIGFLQSNQRLILLR
jgi:hypothetical protein